MRYNFTGDYIDDGKTAGKALMCLAVNDEYNMDTVDAEIAIYEYWHMHSKDAVLIDSIVDAARQYMHKIDCVDFARACLYNRNTLDSKDNRVKYRNLCKVLFALMLQTTDAIIAQISVLSHIKPSELLSDTQIKKIVDSQSTYIG